MNFYKIFSKNLLNKNMNTYHLYNKDFINGTFNIKLPGIYKIMEDITFEPNKKNDFMPLNNNDSAYILGFFAAITIECDNVIIDLNNKTIKQSKTFSLAQRFFSIIELSNSPFSKGMGPANFGDNVIKIKNIIIKNGILGLSSHYSVHGNDCRNILIENVYCKNFEVGGIAINNGDSIFIENCNIGPCRTDVPVLAKFSGLKFLIHLINVSNCLKKNESENNYFNGYNLKQLYKMCNKKLKNIIDTYDKTGQILDNTYLNKKGFIDGNAVGIQITESGIAIHEFSNSNNKKLTYGDRSTNIFINKTKIFSIFSNVNKICIHNIDNSNKPNIIGTSGEIFCLDEIKNSKNEYINDDVINTLCLLYKIKKNNSSFIRTKTLHINEQVLNWIEGGSFPKIISTITGNDRMNHVNKGTMGIRIGGSNNINIENVKIMNLNNIGEITDQKTTNNNLDNPIITYAGADTRGIIFSNCKKIILKKININNIKSLNGSTEGICINNESDNILIDTINIYNFKSKFMSPLVLSHNIKECNLLRIYSNPNSNNKYMYELE